MKIRLVRVRIYSAFSLCIIQSLQQFNKQDAF